MPMSDYSDAWNEYRRRRNLLWFAFFGYVPFCFAFAALMSIINLATPLSDTIGALLYQHVFSGRLTPLIIASAAFTAFVFVLVPLLDRGIARTQARVQH